MANLPDELVGKILLRVEAKPLGRLKSVQKGWCSLISDGGFIKLHTQHMKLHGISTQILSSDVEAYSRRNISQDRRHEDQEASTLPFPETLTVLGLCNGLILARDEDHESFTLLNPTTHDFWKHPIQLYPSIISLEGAVTIENTMYGFGDDEAGDYKVLSISWLELMDGSTSFEWKNMVVSLYNLTTNRKYHIDPPYDMGTTKPSNGVLVDGKLHWIISTNTDLRSKIIAFDLTKEVFTEVAFPPSLDVKDFDLKPARLGCNLCMFGGTLGNDLYIMKKYGDASSWTRITIQGISLNEVEPICSCDNGDDDIVFGNGVELIYYSIRAERDIGRLILDEDAAFSVQGAYVETMLSPRILRA